MPMTSGLYAKSEIHRQKLRMIQLERMKNPENKLKIVQKLKGKLKKPLSEHKSQEAAKKQAKIRDLFTCQICGLNEPRIMEIDHIKPMSKYPELANDLNNLITLCPNCHKRKTIREKEF